MREWIIALRPQYWIVAIFPLLIGTSFSGSLPPLPVLIAATLIWGPIFSGATYLVNQYYDRDLDKRNPRTENLPLVKGEISEGIAKASSVFLFGLGGLLSLGLGPMFASLYLIGVLLSITYSIPLTRLKTRPILSVIVNGIGYGIVALYAGWILTRGLSIKPMVLGIPLTLAITAGYVYKAVEDVDIDENFNVRTIAVELGEIRALKLSWILTLLAYASLFASSLVGWLNLWFTALMTLGLIASLIFLRLLNSPTKNNVRQNGWYLSICLMTTFVLMFVLTRV